ncbi:SurA N-terminal domain-containing protein [Candidatus Saccharibacteria bacterium]|nr:SurA N-terminal domain-containing protein [Candidatus Saccharibacteria bacterium]
MKLPFAKKKELKQQVNSTTIEDHREEILSKGRKFKYPFQYARHKLVIKTIIIGVVAVVLLAGFGWLQLYQLQSTSDILYRFTKVIPLSVAKVDGESVRFSDYLMIFKSSITALEAQEGTFTGSEVGATWRSQYKRQALDSAIEFAYALKLARELDIEITREQILEAEKEHRTVDGVERSEESFAKIIRANFGLSVEEYERLLMLSLTKRAVSAKIDEDALLLAEEVEALLESNGGDFAQVAEILDGSVIFDETGELVSRMNLDGGRADMASRLEIGKWSKKFLSRNGDGYYFVKSLARGEGQVKYVSLRVPFGEFSKRMQTLMDEGKVQEFITIQRTGEGDDEDKN